MTPKDAIETFAKYFEELDSSYDILSDKNEGKISKLPSYVFSKREIYIFKLGSSDFYVIKVIANNSLDEDKGFTGQVNSNSELLKITAPFMFDFNFTKIPDDYGFIMSNLSIKEMNNINALPVVDDTMLAIIKEDRFHTTFSIDKAKEQALNTWNNLEVGFDNNQSFIHNLKKIFDKASLIIKRKSFLERRVHRFIEAHKLYILPSFKNCYYEHEISCCGEKRVADYILERELGFSALMIELESPVHPVFKKNKDLTYQATHAISQITEWASFIDRESANTIGDMEFLAGNKDRLVIIGRGLENIEEMKRSKFSGTTVWTYDLLIKEAKEKWNKFIIDQCKAIGIEHPNLL
jgi:hypothetical protein